MRNCSRLRLGALLLALCGAAGRARAVPSEDAKPAANALLAEARQLYDQGEYGSALDRLNKAYAAFPSPAIHFNFGQVYRALLRDVDALDSFDRFITEGTDQDPGLRHEAEIYVVELTHRVGTLEITAETAGASVAVDGKAAGTTPLRRGLRVMPGAHQIVVLGGDGTIPFVRQVDVAAGQTTRVAATLTTQTPVIASNPPAGPPPVYKRWWLWAGIGVVGGAIVTTLLLTHDWGRDCSYNAGCITF